MLSAQTISTSRPTEPGYTIKFYGMSRSYCNVPSTTLMKDVMSMHRLRNYKPLLEPDESENSVQNTLAVHTLGLNKPIVEVFKSGQGITPKPNETLSEFFRRVRDVVVQRSSLNFTSLYNDLRRTLALSNEIEELKAHEHSSGSSSYEKEIYEEKERKLKTINERIASTFGMAGGQQVVDKIITQNTGSEIACAKNVFLVTAHARIRLVQRGIKNSHLQQTLECVGVSKSEGRLAFTKVFASCKMFATHSRRVALTVITTTPEATEPAAEGEQVCLRTILTAYWKECDIADDLVSWTNVEVKSMRYQKFRKLIGETFSIDELHDDIQTATDARFESCISKGVRRIVGRLTCVEELYESAGGRKKEWTINRIVQAVDDERLPQYMKLQLARPYFELSCCRCMECCSSTYEMEGPRYIKCIDFLRYLQNDYPGSTINACGYATTTSGANQ